MDTAQVVGTIALIVVFGLVMVVAAFADRHRAREIEHDRSRLSVESRRRVHVRTRDQRGGA